MRRILLDTTFLVDSMRDPARVDDLILDTDDVAMAAVTVAELLVGVVLGPDSEREARRAAIEEAMSAIPVVNYDLVAASHHAELMAATRRFGRPRGGHDLIIAATARASGRTVLSSDGAAFGGLPGVASVIYSR
ncbi:MAG: PIN domain-containing protein [Acidimicrobiia bacterium]